MGLNYIMCRAIILCVSVFFCTAGWGRAADLPALQEMNKSVVTECTASTVALVTANGTTGSGVVVSAGGLILTAAHVVEGVDELLVIFPDGKQEKAVVLGANYTRDAAMVKLVNSGPWKAVRMGDSSRLEVGSYVIALGHSKGFDPNRRPPVRFGRIVADGKQRFMMSECTLIGGDSGGPLFNLQGELVGIHSSIGGHLSINNHVPMSVYQEDWKRLSEGEHWGQLGLNPMADPDFPILGFSMAESLQRDGVMVDDVLMDSPADSTGLLYGDKIKKMNNREVLMARDLVRELERHKAGDSIELIVERQGREYKARLVLGRRGDVRVTKN